LLDRHGIGSRQRYHGVFRFFIHHGESPRLFRSRRLFLLLLHVGNIFLSISEKVKLLPELWSKYLPSSSKSSSCTSTRRLLVRPSFWSLQSQFSFDDNRIWYSSFLRDRNFPATKIYDCHCSYFHQGYPLVEELITFDNQNI